MKRHVFDWPADVKSAFFEACDQFALDTQIVDGHVADRVAGRDAAHHRDPKKVSGTVVSFLGTSMGTQCTLKAQPMRHLVTP